MMKILHHKTFYLIVFAFAGLMLLGASIHFYQIPFVSLKSSPIVSRFFSGYTCVNCSKLNDLPLTDVLPQSLVLNSDPTALSRIVSDYPCVNRSNLHPTDVLPQSFVLNLNDPIWQRHQKSQGVLGYSVALNKSQHEEGKNRKQNEVQTSDNWPKLWVRACIPACSCVCVWKG